MKMLITLLALTFSISGFSMEGNVLDKEEALNIRKQIYAAIDNGKLSCIQKTGDTTAIPKGEKLSDLLKDHVLKLLRNDENEVRFNKSTTTRVPSNIRITQIFQSRSTNNYGEEIEKSEITNFSLFLKPNFSYDQFEVVLGQGKYNFDTEEDEFGFYFSAICTIKN